MLVLLLFPGLCTTDSFLTELSSQNARPVAGSKVAAESSLLYTVLVMFPFKRCKISVCFVLAR